MSYSDNADGPVGVGGWMYLFLFGFAGFTPLALLIGTYSNLYSDNLVAEILGSNWVLYQIYEWALVGVTLAIIAYVVWRLFNVRNAATVRLTIAVIVLVNIGFMLLEVLGASFFGGINASAVFRELATEFIRGAIYCAVWCSYFTVSKRVKNTYHAIDEGSLEEVFE